MNAKQYSEALVRKDRRVAELEGENERLRRVIGAAVEDSANLEAERDRAHDDAGNLEGEVNGLKVERDAANTSAIAQRRSFEKALEGRDEIIAELKDEVGDEWARAEQAIERLRQAEAERAALRDRWNTSPPPECGYYIAAWMHGEALYVSELWFNDANGWWTSRGYLNEGRDRGVPIDVLAWTQMPRYQSD